MIGGKVELSDGSVFENPQRTDRKGNAVTEETVLCGNRKCQVMIGKLPAEVETQEARCSRCRGHRAQRCVFATDRADARYREDRFRRAVVVTQCNNNRCHIATKRALAGARERKVPVRIAVAHDEAKADALTQLSRRVLLEKKRTWLRYHDRRCGNLCGLLPLAEGMEVALTQHIERRSGKGLLRGRRGTIVGWQCDPREGAKPSGPYLQYLPRIVYVRFHDPKCDRASATGCTSKGGSCIEWQFGDLEPGVYPIVPRTEDWSVDKPSAKCRGNITVSRRQLPLTPAGAATVHSMQGETRDAVVIAGTWLCSSV